MTDAPEHRCEYVSDYDGRCQQRATHITYVAGEPTPRWMCKHHTGVRA